MLFIAVFTVLVGGIPYGSMLLHEPVTMEECMADLKNDRQHVLDAVRMALPDADIDDGKCVAAGTDL